jgi:hypothetical protein
VGLVAAAAFEGVVKVKVKVKVEVNGKVTVEVMGKVIAGNVIVECYSLGVECYSIGEVRRRVL